MSIVINISLDKSMYLEEYLQEAIKIGLNNATRQIELRLRALTPIDTGNLRATFKATVIPRGIRLTWGAAYAKYPDEGTKKHMIRPVSGEALKWPTGAGWAFSKGHVVAGQVAQYYSTRTAIEAIEIMKREIGYALRDLQTMVS